MIMVTKYLAEGGVLRVSKESLVMKVKEVNTLHILWVARWQVEQLYVGPETFHLSFDDD